MPSSQDSINRNGVFIKAKSKEESTKFLGLARAFHLGLERFDQDKEKDSEKDLNLEEMAILKEG